MRSYTVKQLADLAGITPRTLRHYDRVGLLRPARLTAKGYRQYGEHELLRLQQILFFRELELPLDEIKAILDSPAFDQIAALTDHQQLIALKKRRLDSLLKTITKTINHMTEQQHLNDNELYDAFKDDDIKEYQAEAKQRWGHTDAYRQSMARVGKMTKAEMKKLKEDGKRHTQAIADAMDKGVAHPDVQALIKQSHEGINFFYDCSLDMFRNLGQMYVDDPRFTAYYEKFRPGLAVFMRDAIAHYCATESNRI